MFSVLELNDPEWTSRLESLPAHKRDVHFYPHMLAAYADVYGWGAKAALTVDGDNFIIQPLLITHDGQIRHAYNFGGPIGTDADETWLLASDHEWQLCEWARKIEAPKVTSYYTTLVPFLANEQHQTTNTRVKDVVYIDLNKMKFRGTTRRLANKAQGLGAKVHTVNHTDKNVKIFNQIYTHTMDRAQAKEYWYTPPRFFNMLLAFTNGHLLLLEYKDDIEAGCIIIPSYANKIAYYHYAGSYNRYPKDGVNHMMVAAAAEFAKSLGCDKLHLGGGLTADPKDGLYVFKAGFSDLRAPVYTYKRAL